MLTKTLPTLDIRFNTLGSITTDIYSQDADFAVEPEESDVVTLEEMTKELLKYLRSPDTGRIDDVFGVNAAYNLLDSLRDSISILENALYEEDIDG